MRGHGQCFIMKAYSIKAENLSGVAIICWTSCGWLLQPVWSKSATVQWHRDIVIDCWVARSVWRRNPLCKGVSPCPGYVVGSAGSTAIRLMLMHCKLRLMNLLICEMAHAALADDEAAHKAGASLSSSYASIINMIKHASICKLSKCLIKVVMEWQKTYRVRSLDMFFPSLFFGRVLVKKRSLMHGPSNTVFYHSLSNSALVLPKKLPTQAF